MRPTKVRATVGSRASGSSARPIVSVPPLRMSAAEPVVRAAATAAPTAATATTTIASVPSRLSETFMRVPLQEWGGSWGPHPDDETRELILYPVGCQLDTKAV